MRQIKNEIRLIEEHSMNAWHALQTYLYDGWILRVANGYSKRANSINWLYKSTIDIDVKIDYCQKFYKSIDLPLVFKIVEEMDSMIIDEKLELNGYEKIDETSVKILRLGHLKFIKDTQVRVDNQLTNDWIDGYIKCCNIKGKVVELTLKTMLNSIIGECVFVTYVVAGKEAGFGFGVIDQGYVGIFDVFVDAKYRGRGYSKAIMNALLFEAKELGASTAYLQVVKNNVTAVNLYETIGFKEKYSYWYRRK